MFGTFLSNTELGEWGTQISPNQNSVQLENFLIPIAALNTPSNAFLLWFSVGLHCKSKWNWTQVVTLSHCVQELPLSFGSTCILRGTSEKLLSINIWNG